MSTRDTNDKPAGVGRNRRATSYDVARLAGVSQSAVSRVFKSGASASKEMRERVMQAAEEVGYRPNAIARGLITQRSDMVAVITSRMTNLNFPELLVELTLAFSKQGIRVLLFTIERESETDLVLDQVLQYRVDGVVSAAMLTREQLAHFERAHIPVVFFNRRPSDCEVDVVRCDQVEGERRLVRELGNSGHREFAIISGPQDSVVSQERTQGALREIRELGLGHPKVVFGDYSYESGIECFQAIVEGSMPDAIVAVNDVMAIGAIDAAREHGLHVPNDLSVVGFDGVGAARFAAYDLTTIEQPITRMTRAAVEMVLERIESPAMSNEERVFTGTPVLGSSARLTPQSSEAGEVQTTRE